MGGKKKSLANRLAKMSDEDRARYLQHKADVEEEARRRKEQLIATFFKNKVKKEDAFSRLNLAKINQHWHQVLRFNKCKEMKEEVEHIKKYIDRVLECKNGTIAKLLEELEMAEEQYAHNFQSHVVHIDEIFDTPSSVQNWSSGVDTRIWGVNYLAAAGIAAPLDNYLTDVHKGHLQSLRDEYTEDLNELMEMAMSERDSLIANATREQQLLKTITFGQNLDSKKLRDDNKEHYAKQRDEITCEFRTKIESMVKRNDATTSAIWRQIAATIKNYVQRTDVRRSHLAELRRLDAESAAEIATNQERIKAQEEEIKVLQQEYENSVKSRRDQAETVAVQIKTLTQEFNDVRKQFRKEVQLDEKQLFFMTTISNKTIENLYKLANKGDQILHMTSTCRKYETEREKVAKWLPALKLFDGAEEEEEKERETAGEKTKTKARPKTGHPALQKKSETLSTASDVDVEEMVKSIIISAKSSVSSSSSSSPSGSKGLSRFDHLNDLEEFWIAFNKAEVDCKALREEKKLLLEQNKQYRGMMRAVLEAAVLAQSSAPTSKVSTRAASKRRSAVSAPLKRLII